MKDALKLLAVCAAAMLILPISGCTETALKTETPATSSTRYSSTSLAQSLIQVSESSEISEPPTASSTENSATKPIEESTTSTENINETAEYIINYMQKRTGCTGEDLGYGGEWCARILSDLLISKGYNIVCAETPCDLAVTLLNNDYADFFCFRQKNYDSLVEWGLHKTERVKMMSREDYVPKRGDMICYLFHSEADRYNWSHIGIISENYNGEYISSLEGNIDVDFALKDPLLRYISTIRRPYNDTVVGIIRLK